MELTKIRGISEKRQEELNKLGVFDTSDLSKFFPRAYLDLREKQPLKFAYHNDIVLTNGKVLSMPLKRFYKHGDIIRITCEQEGFIFNVVWFNQSYVATKLKVGAEYLFYGRVRKENGACSLTNPSFELVDNNFRLQGIVPQYKIKGTLNQKVVRDAVRLSVDLERPSSIIPESIARKYALVDLYKSYKEVHNPTSFDNLTKSSERIAIEEYFSLISAFKYIKGGKEQVRVNKYYCSSRELIEFIVNKFPFEFTEGQKNAVNQIYADLTGKTIMNRLIQGDVGSGKTAVSTCAVFIAVKSGYQVAFLAPTEVLARQNFAVLSKFFPEYNLALLTGSNSLKEKKQIKNDLKEGKINIIVGTHALIQEDVEFKRLSLCICDEQQRFGVAQRSSLVNKGVSPDVLVMSATPIPRTLSLIFYGDLDITTITDKPKERIPIQTNIVPEEKYLDMLKFITKEIKDGKQAYFVSPKIDGDEEGEVISVTELFEQLKQKMPGVRIALLHGKMKEKDKNQVIDDFKNKKVDAIVSTTVIEVGVDVPDASVMVIYNAERFGLSQLHQLRGRVGRSNIKSYCFLLTNKKEGESIERLNVVKKYSDGFKIAEYDYKIRGAGDFIGNRQSGKFMNDLGSLNYSTEAIFLAKKISDEVFETGQANEVIKRQAIRKYNKLKDIILN